MTSLKLIALDGEDLQVLSAHLQDAVLKVGDLAYLPGSKRFVAVANRFDWVSALQGGGRQPGAYARRQTGLRFERVMAAQLHGIDLAAKDSVLSLLAIRFDPRDAPAGDITLFFADGGAIRLQVECIEAELRDLGPAWPAKLKPTHPEDERGGLEGR
jgi:hypothetical protein